MKSDKVLDVPGTSCATLTPMIKQNIKTMREGQILEVHSDDPAARLGVPAWSRLTGNNLVETIEKDDEKTIFYIQKSL